MLCWLLIGADSNSLLRSPNAQGFRKVDPDHWEFSNENFARGRRDLLGSIVRRKPASAAGGRGGGADDAGMAEPDSHSGDALRAGNGGAPQQPWGFGGGPPNGFTSPREEYAVAGGGYGMGPGMDTLGSGSGGDLPVPRVSSAEPQDHRSAFRRPAGFGHMRGGSTDEPWPPPDPHSSAGSGATANGQMPPHFGGPFDGQQQQQRRQQAQQQQAQLRLQSQPADDKSHLQRLAEHAHSLQQPRRGGHGSDQLQRRSDNDSPWWVLQLLSATFWPTGLAFSFGSCASEVNKPSRGFFSSRCAGLKTACSYPEAQSARSLSGMITDEERSIDPAAYLYHDWSH